MYLEHFRLERKPFAKTPDAAMLFESPAHAEALARMEQAVEDRELMVLTGAIGSGKTTLSRALLDRLPDDVRPALIINPKLSPNQLLRAIAHRLGADHPKYFRADLVEQVHDLLYNCHQAGVLPLLIIDEAQAIPTKDAFEEVRLLTNFQLDDLNLMAIILIGQPELARRLAHPAYEALRQRVGVRYHLGPLPPEAVGSYIQGRLAHAGRKDPLFTDAAVAAIADYSRGTPRWINNLCGAALLQGFAEDAELIDARIVHDVAQDLGILPGGRPSPGPDTDPQPDGPDQPDDEEGENPDRRDAARG